MRNLKKVLALVVAVAMIASMGLVASAASYSDVAANAKYADAVNLLSNLGIIKGYEDGTFKPDNTVTRAEAATMIVRVLGLAEDVEQGETNFTDVAADNWASGYINVAEANGIINGMGDGTFNPNGEVTYGQIVKMIVCALGYEPMAEAHGGYLDGGYIYAGSKTGFTKGVAGTANAAASRATVAQLIYNALEVELMDQKTYSTGIYGDTFEVLEGQTILSEYLELEKVEGVVVETYLSNVDDFSMENDKTIDLAITKNYAEDAEYAIDETAYEFICEDANVAALLGYSVVAYVGENEDGDAEIFAIAEKAGKNSTLTLDVEDIEELTAESVKYWKTSNKTVEADIEAFVKAGKGDDAVEIETANQVVNGFNVYAEATDIFEEYAEEYCRFEEITLLDNDGDGEFEFVFATIPSENYAEFVVEEVEEEENTYYVTGEEEELEIDYEAEEVLYTVVKDGKIVDASAIAENDVITVLDKTLSIVTIYVSSVVVEGVVEEIEDEYYTINGKEYETSSLSAVEELVAGDEGKFYLNASGKIAYADLTSDGAAADFVYVIDADLAEGDFDDDEYLVKVVTAKGEVEVLTIKSKKVVIDGEKNKTDEEAYEAIVAALGEETGVLAKIDTTAAGELSAIYFEDSEFVEEFAFDAENTYEYNEARGRYNKAELAADTLVFHVDTEEEDVEDAITVTTVGDLFVDGETYTFNAYATEADEDIIVLVVFDATTSVNAEAPVMVVTKVSTVTSDDEKTVKLTGIVAGETVSVVVDPEENAEVEDFEKGDVVLYATNAGLATDVVVLYDGENLVAGEDMLANAFSDDSVTIHVGEITEDSKKSFYVGEDEFFFGDDVNVTVVTLNGNGTIEVKKGSTSSVSASSKNYTRTAFVKTEVESEDIVTDIVVFVENN